MGRIQIAKIGGGTLNPPYTYSTSPTIGNTDPFTFALSNIIISKFSPDSAFEWDIGPQSPYTETQIQYSDVNTIEAQVKFNVYTTPNRLCELFSLCSIFTPDMDTDGYFKFWDNNINAYWTTYPFYHLYKKWAYMKLNYDKATSTQTWSISEDGVNFSTIGSNVEDRNSEIEAHWDGNTLNNFMLGAMMGYENNTSFLTRINDTTYVDLNETYLKVNDNIICRGILQGS